ncbi:hypothetical protein EDC04DRAFT_2849809 [Pisolithus marmoratus]|nr:hypothetical protein EDC04DRAFT_2849809 [Pisolithus marmoratus]
MSTKGFYLTTAGLGWFVCKTSALSQRRSSDTDVILSLDIAVRLGVTYFLLVATLLSTRKNQHGQFSRHTM